MTFNLAIKNWLTIDAESITNYPDGVNQIYKCEIDGMLIKGVFSKEEMLSVQNKLNSKKEVRDPLYYGAIQGAILVAKGSDRTQYFQDATILREDLKNLFKTNYEARVEAILTKMSRGRTVEIPREDAQKIYTPATIRFVHPNKGGIKLHRGNEFLGDGAYDYMNQIAKIVNGLSYFIVIDKAEQGGELVLYDLLPEQLATPKKDLDLDKCNKRYLNPDIGDMILFQGGSIFHAVADVQGNKERITIGGFVAISKDDQKVFYWS
jgi:hypothetical protein